MIKTFRESPSAYAAIPVTLCLATLLTYSIYRVVPYSPECIYLLSVAAASWFGGRGPGLITAFLAPLALDYFFLPPLYTLGYTPETWRMMFPFLLFALGAAWLSSAQSEAKRAKIDLVQSEARFHQILTHLPDVAWTVNRSGQIQYLSPKITEFTGFTPEEFYAGGMSFAYERVHPEDRRRLRNEFIALFANGQPFDIEIRFQKKDETWTWLHTRAVGTYRRGRDLVSDGIVHDITAYKAADAELKSKTALLEAQMNSTIDGILVVDSNEQRILENKRFAEIFKFPPELLASRDGEPSRNYAQSLMKDPASFEAKFRYLEKHPMEAGWDEIEFKDGTILDRYSSPVLDDAGKYYGRIWTFRDVTERRRNEDTLRQLSMAVEQSPAIVLITDQGGCIGYVNRKFTECTGYTADEVLGKNPRILNSGYTSAEAYRILWQTIMQGREWHGEFRNRKKNGELYWEAAAISPILNEAGVITHFLALKEDITERRSMEDHLRQAQKLEGIGQLAAGIAHEINTPTQFVTDNLVFLKNACSSTARLLEKYRGFVRRSAETLSAAEIALLEQEEKDIDLDFISTEVPRAIIQGLDGMGRVAKIVKAMKAFSHPDSGEKVQLDLNNAIESTITIARNEWKYVADIDTDFEADLPPIVCYPGEINQVILNLLVNAAHAIEEKTKKESRGRITISTRLRDQYVEIAIADTGAGIPYAIQTRIYEPFFTTKEVGKGTGQGLALAHSIVVKKHHGKIWFNTEVGKGTTFFIDLPFEPDTPAA